MPYTDRGIYYADTNTPIQIDTITAAMATSIGNNLSVGQIKFGSANVKAVSTTTSYIDSGLSATITPSAVDRNILVLAFVPYSSTASSGTTGGVDFAVYRSGTNIHSSSQRVTGPTNPGTSGVWSCTLLDSPASTDPQIYNIRFHAPSTANTSNVNSLLGANAKSTIVLVEIAS